MTSGQVCDRLDITYRQLDHWTRRGWITPTIEADGYGTRRGWTEKDVKVARVVRDMIRRPTPDEIRQKVAEVDC